MTEIAEPARNRRPRSPAAAVLRRVGRQPELEARVVQLLAVLHQEHLRQLPLVKAALSKQVLVLLLQLDAARRSPTTLRTPRARPSTTIPDTEIILRFPGLAEPSSARVLTEIGDDRARSTDARALNAYAGPTPDMRASGSSYIVV